MGLTYNGDMRLLEMLEQQIQKKLIGKIAMDDFDAGFMDGLNAVLEEIKYIKEEEG